ncbi:MAG TPA: hypothetical protein VGP87_07180 [Gemmatimonadales bacterium]|nr:hypothetical protein [Gemmatimonadales bacterium]
MSDQKSHNIAEIESLLGSRQQLTGWLDRLDATGTRAPESVRTKVRADYRARLAQVVTQLGTHADLIASTLEGLKAQAREFGQLRSEELEVRAEAELRHSVGEYSDDEWQLVELESSGKIDGFDQELDRLTGEIGRLEEVQSLIQPTHLSAAAPAPAPVPQPVHEPEFMVTHGVETPPMHEEPMEQPALTLVKDEAPPLAPAPRPEAPRFVPRGGAPKPRESGGHRSIPFPQSPAPAPAPAPQQTDELAFLRSVTLDSPATTRPAPSPAPTAVSPLDREERSSATVAKTLKCSECGSLNRPTEWYCERCGAELAAL